MRNDQDMLYNASSPSGFSAPRDYRAPEKPKEPNMLRAGLVAGGIAVAVLGAMSLWSWGSHKHGGVPVVEADTRPVREKPTDQGGMKVEGANEAILSGNTDSRAVVAPAPESPALAALRGAGTPSTNPAPPPAPIVANPPDDKVRVSGLAEVPKQKLFNVATPPPLTTPSAPAPATIAEAKPAAHPPAKAVAGSAMVQLAALRSETAAHTEWTRLEKKYPGLLGGHEPNIVSADRDGQSFWRLRVTGFADKKNAVEFCAKLKAAGGQCSLAAG